MADTRHILEDEALDFVLKDRGNVASPQEEADDQVATIRGNLEQVSLPDIFQTLTMSRMEGTLRITQGWEPTYVHFSEGKVRVLPPEELQTRRLGNRLVTSGLLEGKDVRQAFVESRKKGVALADILEATGRIERIQFDAIRLALEEDFLLELFTLKHGNFAFFKESYPLPGLEERFHTCVPFETETILFETARRSDEWVTILETIGDLDELFVRTGSSFPTADDLNGDLYKLVDGKRTLRDIAGGMLDALFDVAKAAKWLVDHECIERAPAAHLLGLAREAIDEQQLRRSLFYLKLVVESRRTRPDQLEEVASLFVQAGDNRAAASVMLRLASRLQDPDRRLEVLAQARKLDGLNIAVLESIVEVLRANSIAGDAILDDALEALCALYVDAGRFEEGLTLCEELEIAHPGDLNLAGRKARILHGLGRTEDGVAHLERLKEVYRYQNDVEALTKTLEYILRLDPRNAKARAELRTVQESKGVRRMRRFGLVLGLALTIRVGWGFWSSWHEAETAARDIHAARTLFESGRVDEAKTLAESIARRNIDDATLGEAVAIVERAERHFANVAAERRSAQFARLLADIQAAVDELERGEWVTALATYSQIALKYAKVPEARAQITQSLETRFKTLDDELREEIESFQGSGLAEVPMAESASDRRRLHARMENWFPVGRLASCRSFLEAFDRKEVQAPVPIPNDVVARMRAYLSFGEAHKKKRIALAELITKDSKTEELNVSFVAAQRAEEEYAFERAAELYGELAQSYVGSEDTAKLFSEKRDRYKNIVEGVREVAAATELGQHEAALDLLGKLRQRWPEIPFETLLALPFKVSSSPSGATVFDGDKVLGTTPLLVRYTPGNRLKLRVVLDGFFAVDAPESIEDKGRYDTMLEVKPRSHARFEGATTRLGVATTGRYVGIDRKNAVIAFDGTTLSEVWKTTIEDESGDLGAILNLVNKLILVSPFGIVRALSPIDGKLLWSRDLGRRLVTPALTLRGDIFVLDRGGKLHVLDASSGEVTSSTPLGQPMRLPPLAVDKNSFAVLDESSTLRLFDDKGVAAWAVEIEGAGWSAPVLCASTIVVVAGNRIEARRQSDGSLAWTAPLSTTPRLDVAVADDRIAIVVGNRELVLMEASSGRVVASTKLADRPSATPRILEEGVLVSLEKGGTLLLDRTTLSERMILASDMTSEVSAGLIGDSTILLSGNDGQVRAFDRALLSKR